MAGDSKTQASFTSGELSPALYGRVDFAKYYTGLKTCRNMLVRNTGGVSNRPGTRFVGEVMDSTIQGRLIPFQYNVDQSFVLEFGDQVMRIISQGAYVEYPIVTTPGTAESVTGMTSAVTRGRMVSTPTSLTVPGHDFSNGQKVTILGVASGLDGTQTVVYIDSDTVGFYVNTSALGIWTGAGTVTAGVVTAGNLVEVASPYAAVDLPKLKFAQCNDVVTFVHPSYPPQQLGRYSDTDWRWSQFPNVNGPYLDINSDKTKAITASAETGTITLTSNFDAFTRDMVGLDLYLEQGPDSNTPAWQTATAILAGAVVTAGVNYYLATTSGTTGATMPTIQDGVQYDGNPGIGWQFLHSGHGDILITGTDGPRLANGTVQHRLPALVTTGGGGLAITAAVPVLQYQRTSGSSGTYYIYLGTYNYWPVITTSAPHGFVTGSTQQITGATGLAINGMWVITVLTTTTFCLVNCMALTGTYIGYGMVVTPTPVAPSYKWAFSSWGSVQGYPTATTYYQQRQVFAGTPGRPSTVNMSTTAGYLDFEVNYPMLDTDSITFTLAGQELNEVRHIIELNKCLILTNAGEWLLQGSNDVITPASVNVKRQGYSGVSHIAPIIIDNQALFIQEKGSQVRSLGYSWQTDLYSGTDISLMSRHLLEGFTIVAWAFQRTPWGVVWAVRNDGVLLSLTYLPDQDVVGWSRHDTDGLYEDVVGIGEGAEDAIYFTVNRTIDGVAHRYVERLANRSFTNLQDAYFVDCGLSFSGTPSTTFSGLNHLEGKQVAILADGCVIDAQTVTGGAITIPHAASTVHAGLPYTSQMETLDLASSQQEIKDKMKFAPHLSVMVDQTSGFMAGSDMNHLDEFKQRSVDDPYGASPMMQGIYDHRIQASWGKPGRITIVQDQPLPLTVLSVIQEVTYGGV